MQDDATKVVGVLLFFSAHLTLSQQQYHAFEQEFIVLLKSTREPFKQIGRAACLILAVHYLLVREPTDSPRRLVALPMASRAAPRRKSTVV